MCYEVADDLLLPPSTSFDQINNLYKQTMHPIKQIPFYPFGFKVEGRHPVYVKINFQVFGRISNLKSVAVLPYFISYWPISCSFNLKSLQVLGGDAETVTM